MNKYMLQGKLKAKPGERELLEVILLDAAKLISTAKGCHLYAVGLDGTDGDSVFVTEIWDSRADHDNSLNIPGVRELISTAIPTLDGPPEKGREIDILGGFGV